MTSHFVLVFVATSGLILIVLGAFGMHVLSKTMRAVEIGWAQTGLEYRAFHMPTTLDLAVTMQHYISIRFYQGNTFPALDVVLFSGDLYHLALSHLRLWTPVIPVDGVNFLAGRALMLTGAACLKRKGISHEQSCTTVPSGL